MMQDAESEVRRVVVDALASREECAAAVGCAIVGMDGLSERNGETTLVASEGSAADR